MKLYEIHAAILSLLDQLEPDPETGELPDSTDAVLERIDALQMAEYLGLSDRCVRDRVKEFPDDYSLYQGVVSRINNDGKRD